MRSPGLRRYMSVRSMPQGVHECAQHAVLACLLSLVRIEGGVEHGADRQREDHEHTHDRKAQAWLLGATLRIGFLVDGGIGAGNRGAINEAHTLAKPMPVARAAFLQPAAEAACQ